MSKENLVTITGAHNISAINDNFRKIETALDEKVLYRDNPEGEPNQMENPLDMNGERIYNLPEPKMDHEPARKIDLDKLGKLNRNIRVSDRDIPPLLGASQRAGKYLTFDAQGNPVADVPVGDQAAWDLVVDKAIYHADTKGEAVTLAVSLPEGAQIEVKQDESEGGATTRYRNASGTLVTEQAPFISTGEHGTWPLSEFVQELPPITQPSGNDPVGGFDTIEKLRAYAGYATTVKVGVLATRFPFISFAEWRLDLSDTTSVDDGVVVAVDAKGRRWKRVILESTFYPEWAGAFGDGTTDDSNAVQKILNIAAQYKGEVKGAPGREYVTRWVNVPSNVTVSDIRILQKIESQTWTTTTGSRKRAFHMENAKNVTFNRVYVNGRRMYQNILKDGFEMAENGGCFAFAISGGCENILIDDCLVEDMATDALHIDGWLDSGRAMPKNITVRRSTFKRSRRNNISLLAGSGVTLDDLQLDDSGKVLTGAGYISGAGPCYLPGSATVWSSPSIDLEPENGEYLENITITNIRYSGNRMDFLLYASAAKTNIRINNIRCENWTIRGTATSDSIQINQDADTDTIPIHNIILRNMNIYGDGRIHLWGGDGIVLDRVKTYEEDGTPRAKAFGATWNKLFIIKHAKNVRVSNVDIDDDGLVMNVYGSYAGQRQGIIFDNTCTVSDVLPTGSLYDDVRARAANYFPAPPLHKTGKDYELPVFREGTTAFFEPVFAANIQGGGVPFGGFMGWVPSYTAERTASATPTGGVINVNATSPQDVGCKLAVILASGKIEYKTITAVNSSTQYAVSPNLGVALSGGEYIRILKYKPAWAITRQSPIEKLSTTDAISNKVNQLIDVLKAANVLNNEGF